MDLSAGTVLGGNFRLESLLGTGGMGVVWQATDLTLGRSVAIKILHADLGSDPHTSERFHREARLLAALEHPGIVPIYSWLTVTDAAGRSAPCIVMPLVRGLSLAEALRRDGPMPLARALDVMTSLLDALAAAHRAGVVHRDLKPQNIILEERDGPLRARLLDFGIAKSLVGADAQPNAIATQRGVLLGTPEYMSPEQIRDPAHVDARADLWAASVCFFEMLTGRRPYSGAQPVETIAQVLEAPRRSACAIDSRLPRSIDEFFARALAGDAGQRPDSAAAMQRSLQSLALNSFATQPSGTPRAPVPSTEHARHDEPVDTAVTLHAATPVLTLHAPGSAHIPHTLVATPSPFDLRAASPGAPTGLAALAATRDHGVPASSNLAPPPAANTGFAPPAPLQPYAAPRALAPDTAIAVTAGVPVLAVVALATASVLVIVAVAFFGQC